MIDGNDYNGHRRYWILMMYGIHISLNFIYIYTLAYIHTYAEGSTILFFFLKYKFVPLILNQNKLWRYEFHKNNIHLTQADMLKSMKLIQKKMNLGNRILFHFITYRLVITVSNKPFNSSSYQTNSSYN